MLLNIITKDICFDKNKKNMYHKFSLENTDYYWTGVFFIRGMKSGAESVKKLAESFQYNGVNALDFENFMGAFTFIIKENNGRCILFTDNSNQRGFYISDNFVSESFIELLHTDKGLTLSKEAVCEYLVYGQTFFLKTLVNGITISDSKKYYIVDGDSIESSDKKIANIDGKPEDNSLNELYRDIAYGISNLKVSLALTGGFDSRMVLVLLKDGVKIDTCISGDNIEDKDIIISQRVAEACGLKHEIEKIPKPDITEEYLYKSFIDRDAPALGYGSGDLRIYEMLKNRKAKKYDIHMTGDSGIYYKDEDWLQEFPLYNKKKFSIEKFYRQRIRCAKCTIPFSETFAAAAKKNEERILNTLNEEKRQTNTKSFDWYSWNIKNSSGRKKHLMSSSAEIDLYCPMLELKSVRFSYNLPRRKRFKGNVMKAAITKADQNVAKIPTLTGETTSYKLNYRFYDVFMYAKSFCVRALRYFCRIAFKKRCFDNDVLTWDCSEEVRNSDTAKKAFEFAVNQGIINCRFNEVNFDLLSKLINLYFINREIVKGN